VCVVCGGGGSGVGLLPKKCYWRMDVLLREHKVYVDTVKLINNIKIFRGKKTKNIKPYFKTALQFFFSIDNVSLGAYMYLVVQFY